MSDEAAFLEVLKANPADDTARLVYADWLDEHNEPQKAEYLRLVVQLAQMREEYTLEQPFVTRLLALAEPQPVDWCGASGSRFSLVLYNYHDKIRAIKTLRLLKGFGLGEAKAASEQLPFRIYDEVPFEIATAGHKAFQDDDGLVVLIHPSDLTPLPVRVVFTITAYRFAWEGAPDPPAALQQSVAAFTQYLSHALGISVEAARALAIHEQVTLAEDIDSSVFHARYHTLLQLLPDMPPDDYDWEPDAPTPEWGIRLNYNRRAIIGKP